MGNVYSNCLSIVRGSYPRPPGVFFTKELYRKNYAVYPIMAIIVVDIIHGIFYCIWQTATREISIDRSKKPINYRMSLLKPYFLRLRAQEGDDLRPLPELHQIYLDMKKADEKLKLENKC